MTSRKYSLIGLIAPVWFLIVYLIMSSLRPEYSFLTKAISELGSVDAPHKWWWNFLGYVVPGLMISIFFYGLFKNISIDGKNKLPLVGMLGSGIFMSFAGIFPGDFENKQSLSMLLHTVGSFGSYIFFLIGAFSFASLTRKSVYWSSARKPLLLFTWLTILLGVWPFLFPQMPGVGQRLVFLFYFIWIFYTAWNLYKFPQSAQQN